MTSALRYGAQALVYGAIVSFIGYFSTAPAYHPIGTGEAQIKIALVHGGTRVGCRERTAEELAKLAPNMRKKLDCPRERVPLALELDLDGRPLSRITLPPGGLSKDGPSRLYERYSVAAGPHTLAVRMRDSGRSDGFDYERSFDIDLAAGRSLAIDFRAEMGGFVVR
ncbi:MAG: hypothetical protein U1F33_09910 [Alphaproteobacteria bacterium]